MQQLITQKRMLIQRNTRTSHINDDFAGQRSKIMVLNVNQISSICTFGLVRTHGHKLGKSLVKHQLNFTTSCNEEVKKIPNNT
jgi:hypothetical protein